MDIFQSLDFEVLMPRHRGAYPEFRRQMVDLVRSGRTPEELAREFCRSSDDLRQTVWVRKGGSGSWVDEVMRPAVDAASGDWRLSGV